MTENDRPTMIIGDVALLHGARPAPDASLVEVLLPLAFSLDRPPNTLVITLNGMGDRIICRALHGRRRVGELVCTGALVAGSRPGIEIASLAARLGLSDDVSRLTPLFCAMPAETGLHLYSRTHQLPGRWCFVRTNAEPIDAHGADGGWLAEAVARHHDHRGVLNNHLFVTPAGFRGKEVEIKFNLPPNSSTWALAMDAYTRLAAGDIPDMIPRFGDDFEIFDYDNYLFDVIEPEAERGYVSFMQSRPGWYRIKRKHFTKDSLVRPEAVTAEFQTDLELADYVRDVLGLRAKALPPFRRIRYDVMLESAATGNHFCIIFDRCTPDGVPGEPLVQCEIEYLRSRRVLPLDEEMVLNELGVVVNWCTRFLASHGIVAEPGHYSKLSYLRDLVTRRPPPTGHQVTVPPHPPTYSW